MKRILLSLVAIATIAITSFGQAPEGFKYQAVVRDAGNTVLNNQAVGMQIEILQGGIGGTVVYTESFAPTTNTYGLVNLEIGTGTTSDDFTSIDWANDTYFIRTSLDVTGGSSYAVMGTSQLVSVPYALHAKTAGSALIDNVNDADADPLNEMNTSVVLNGTNLETTDGNGTLNTDLSSLVDDADADPLNEMNTAVVLNGTDLETTDGNGTIVTDLSSLVDDADADPLNEMNTSVVLNGTNLETTDGNGTLNTDLSSLVDDADADPLNEMNTAVVLNGTDLETTDGNGTIVTDLSSLVDDADADATNELQNIEQVLVVGSDANGNNILNIGQIGIGTSSPNTSAGIDMNTTTGALLLPRLTISQRDLLTPAEGMMIYNLDELKFQGYTYGEDYGSPVIDQVQSLFNNANISLDKSQSFQAGISGILNNVKVRLNKAGPGGTVTIKIRAGIGNGGAILYQEDVYVSYVSGGFLYSINPTNVIVSAGQSYTINITNVLINLFDSDFDWFMDTNNPYPQGDFYYDGMNITNFDAVFETSVMPLLPSTLQWVNLH